MVGSCLRHWFQTATPAWQFMANGGDVPRLSRTLGHTSLAVADGYLRTFSSRSACQGKSVPDNIA